MEYDEACEAIVSRAEARAEVRLHHQSDFDAVWAEFIKDCGDHAEYRGRTVLDWLGY